MIGRGDEESVDGFVVQYFAEIFDSFRFTLLLGGDDFGGAIDSVVIDVAEVGDFDVGDLQERIAMIEAAAQAHHADQQLVAG